MSKLTRSTNLFFLVLWLIGLNLAEVNQQLEKRIDKPGVARVRRGLKDTPRAQEVNLLSDSELGQNYPLRPYTLTNLTDILAVEYTCNDSLSDGKSISPDEGCSCAAQLLREGAQASFDECCAEIWNWLQDIKDNPDTLRKVMYYSPNKGSRSDDLDDYDYDDDDDDEADSTAVAEFFDQYKEKASACLDGSGFGDLRADVLTGSIITPCKFLIAIVGAFMAYNLYSP